MVEIDVSRFQNAHHLDTFNRLSVEGNTSGGDNLRNQSLQGEGVDIQNTALNEVAETV